MVDTKAVRVLPTVGCSGESKVRSTDVDARIQIFLPLIGSRCVGRHRARQPCPNALGLGVEGIAAWQTSRNSNAPPRILISRQASVTRDELGCSRQEQQLTPPTCKSIYPSTAELMSQFMELRDHSPWRGGPTSSFGPGRRRANAGRTTPGSTEHPLAWTRARQGLMTVGRSGRWTLSVQARWPVLVAQSPRSRDEPDPIDQV